MLPSPHRYFISQMLVAIIAVLLQRLLPGSVPNAIAVCVFVFCWSVGFHIPVFLHAKSHKAASGSALKQGEAFVPAVLRSFCANLSELRRHHHDAFLYLITHALSSCGVGSVLIVSQTFFTQCE